MNDKTYMDRALALAREAALADEVPVGAVIVKNGNIIAEARNRREESSCATHHAEMLAIEEACRQVGSWHLDGCTLYVTLEPCPMCAGACVNARIDRVVYGAADERGGALGSLLDLTLYPLNHRPTITRGVEDTECKNILREYFRKKR